ncbi:DUF4397 domain-containing protein [bacterium]|nr:DUF4397 domain-containing protein [bacterium]
MVKQNVLGLILVSLLISACSGGGGDTGSGNSNSGSTKLSRTRGTGIRLINASFDSAPLVLTSAGKDFQTSTFGIENFFSSAQSGPQAFSIESVFSRGLSKLDLTATLEKDLETTVVVSGDDSRSSFAAHVFTEPSSPLAAGSAALKVINAIPGQAAIVLRSGTTATTATSYGAQSESIIVTPGVHTIEVLSASGSILQARVFQIEDKTENTFVLAGSRALGARVLMPFRDLD